MSESLIVKLVLAALPQVPAIVNDFIKTLRDAQTNEDAKTKLKTMLSDVETIIGEISKVL